MRKCSEIKTLPLLSIEEGKKLEKPCRLAVNPQTRRVDFFTVSGTPWYQAPVVLPFAKVRSIGRDLIAIANSRDIVAADGVAASLASLVDIKGLPVLDAVGQVVSPVADFAIEESTGALVKLILADGAEVDAADIVTISAAAVIVGSAPKAAAPAVDPQSEFLLGKTVAADVLAEDGTVVVAAGTTITAEVIDAAKLANALFDLVTSAQ